MSRNSRTSLGLIIIAAIAGGVAAFLRRVSLRHAADALAARIPKGAMAIRRESLLDLTIPGRPFRQTVFIAESADETDVLAAEAEDASPTRPPFSDPLSEHDPSDGNASRTMTDDIPEPHETSEFDAAQLHAEAEAVLAEAERIEEDASIEESFEAPDSEAEIPEDEQLGADEEPVDEAAIEEALQEDTLVPEPAADESVEAPVVEAEPVEEPEPEPVIKHVPAEDGGSCPISHGVKVRFATGRYYEPGSPSYDSVVADACYLDAAAAIADGYSESTL